MTTPSILGSGVGSIPSSSDATFTLPIGVNSGDLLIYVTGQQGSTVPSPATGGAGGTWTAIDQIGSSGTTMYSWWRTASSADSGATLTAPHTSTNGQAYFWCVLRGCNNTTPVDAHAHNTGTTQTSLTAPTVTLTGSNDLVLDFWWAYNPTGITPPATLVSSSGPNAITSRTPSSGSLTGDSATFTGGTMVDSGATTIGFLLMSAPLAPTLNSPANSSYQDLSGTPTFSWTYNPSSGNGSQNAYAFRRKVSGSGSYSYWNAGTSSWQSTTVWNSSVTTSVTFPTGAWPNGSVYNWSVATQEATDGLQGPFASDFTVTAQNPPTVSVTAPTGTIANFTPTVTWTDTLASGAAQTSYRVVVYSAAQYTAQGFAPGSGSSAADSGTVNTADTSWPIPSGDLSNNTSYRAYVQVTETGGQTSTWSYSAFTLSVDTPAPPVVTATTGTDPTTGLPLFNLSVQGTDNLLSVDDASFEGSIGTWTATNASLAQDATHSVDGSYSLLLTITAAANADGVTAKYTAVGGLVHTAMASVLAQTTARQITAQIDWYDSNGTLISSTVGSAVTETVGSFVLVSASGTAPSNAASASLQVNVASGAAGEKHNIDKAGIRPGTTSTTWYRGGLVGSTTAAVQRSDNLYVRNASTTTQLSIPASNQLATVVDAEVVPTVSYTYTATVSAVVSSSVTLVSPTSAASGSVTLSTDKWWEFDPTDLTTAVAAQPTEFNPQVTEQSTAHLVIGQATPNVIASAMGATDGTATFETFDMATYTGLANLLQSQKTVFISNPFGNPYGVLYARFGPQTGGMSGGAGNKVKDAHLHPSTAAAPHHELSVSWVAQPRVAV